LLPHEAERLRKAETKSPHEVTWAPILWACKLIQRARTDGKITLETSIYRVSRMSKTLGKQIVTQLVVKHYINTEHVT
jgi:hypothetical protein